MTASRSTNADEKAGKRVRLLIVDDDDVAAQAGQLQIAQALGV